MARTHVVDNFVNFQDGWRRLGLRETDAPVWTGKQCLSHIALCTLMNFVNHLVALDFTILGDEIKQAPNTRAKSLRILNAIEAVLNME
jgi:hypothetical protein